MDGQMIFDERLGSRVPRHVHGLKNSAQAWQREQKQLEQMRGQFAKRSRPASTGLGHKPCVDLLFEIARLGNRKDRLAQMKSFPDQLISRGADEAFAGRQILDESMIAHGAEFDVSSRRLLTQSVHDRLAPAAAERLPQRVRGMASHVDQDMFARWRPIVRRAKDAAPQQDADPGDRFSARPRREMEKGTNRFTNLARIEHWDG